MKFERSWTGNWDNAFHGLRHPMESYAKSDSVFGIADEYDWAYDYAGEVAAEYTDIDEFSDVDRIIENGHIRSGDKDSIEYAYIGPKDMDLAQRMIKAKTPNDKFLRQIFVSVDITAPLYWWKEMDTYKVATVANSTSTMHKLATTPITIDCFETDDFDNNIIEQLNDPYLIQIQGIISFLETLRLKYLETKDKRYWKELIRWLPESWLQTRTWTANYATLRNIIHWRQGHKLTEWAQFIEWCHTLPYAEELLFFDNK